MYHHVDSYESDDDYYDDNDYLEKSVKNKTRQKDTVRTRRKLEARLDAKRLRKLLDDFTDY